MAPVAIFVPEPPVMHGALAPLPDSLKAQWKETYLKAHKQAAVDSPNEANFHPQRARKTANQLLEVRKPTSYAEAMALPEWQVMKREVKNGQLVLVTIEARGPEPATEDEPRSSKFFFDVPEAADVADEPEKPAAPAAPAGTTATEQAADGANKKGNGKK